ncbi:hypothetical protein Pelo_9502 [Pelomyxa schiedti]|nr:hypothetical protein Pelo_9502 [Pelomyxa schiedti]
MQPDVVCAFGVVLVVLLIEATSGQAVNGYYIRNSDKWLVHLTDLSNPAGTQICQVTALYLCGDFKSGDTDKIYAIKSTDNTLHSISTKDCKDTEIGPTGAPVSDQYCSGMGWSDTQAAMVVTFTDRAYTTANHEGTVDLDTGAFTECCTAWFDKLLDIAEDAVPGVPGVTAIFHVGADAEGLFWWWMGLGVMTTLPGTSDPVRFTDESPGGMSHDPTTGKLLAIGVESGMEQLVEIDRNTGAVAKRYTSQPASNAACLCFGPIVSSTHSAECIARPK